MSETRQRIISSLFSAPNSENSYESHVKIWEDDESGGKKPRFIVLARNNPTGKGKLLKTKLNTTGTFSVGKTWELDSMRGLEVIDSKRFNISLARTYRWDTENPREQSIFLSAIVRLFRQTNPGAPLNIVGNVAEDIPRPDADSTPRTAPASRSGFTAPPGPDPAATPRTMPLSSSRSGFTQVPETPRLVNGPPPTARRIPQHSRTPSSASFGVPPSPSSISTSSPSASRRPSAINGASEAPPSPTSTATSSRRSPSPSRRQLSNRRAPRPSALNINEIPPRPPLSPQRSTDGRSDDGLNSLRTARPSARPSVRGTSPARSVTESLSAVPNNLRQPASAAARSVSYNVTDDPPPSTSRTVMNGIMSAQPLRVSSESQRSQRSATPSSRQDQVDGQRQSLDVPRPSSPAYSSSSQSRRNKEPSSSSRAGSPPRSQPTSLGRASPAPSTSTTTSTASRRKERVRETSQERSSKPPKSARPRKEKDSSTKAYDPQKEAEKLLAGTTNSTVVDDEDLEATLANVEELLEGYEWASGLDARRRNVKGAADQIEARLIGELNALEKANTHSFIESDDRIAALLGFIDEAIGQLNEMNSLISSYKVHLNVVSDDISHIQSQHRGLQVQTQNQKLLLDELDQLASTVNVDRGLLTRLAQEKLDSASGVERLEQAAAELYKALQASQDRDMAASMDRLGEYQTFNAQFCQRLSDFLQIMFPAQIDVILNEERSNGRASMVLQTHETMEIALGRYSGLILYLKEMDESRYGKLCGAYFSTASELHARQIRSLLSKYAGILKNAPEEESETTFFATPATARQPVSALRRAGTVMRLGAEDRKDKAKEPSGDVLGYEALKSILGQIHTQVNRENDFLADFLQINEAGLTFADYMNLESYFRRQASRSAGLGAATMKLIRNAMDLIFGFLPEELKQWIEAALQRDNLHIVGMIATVERILSDTEDHGNNFFLRLLDKQHSRMKAMFDRHVDEQIKAVEKTKVTVKKRRGVAPFIKFFPAYVQRIETQLIGANYLEVRGNVDAAYERIVDAMFDVLQQMAKMEGEGEDKDKSQLNYHVVLIENMHLLLLEISQLDLGAMGSFTRRAQTMYDENISAYAKIVLRRPFSKILDYFDGVDRLLQTTAPSEISNNASYNKSALKRVLKEYNGKDIKRLVDALNKRVEKHFAEASGTEEGGSSQAESALAVVWKACEDETLASTARFAKLIGQCYSASNLTLEYSVADVRAAFKRRT